MSWWTVSVEAPAAMADALAFLIAEQLDLAVEVQDGSTMDKSDGTASRVLARMTTPPAEQLPAQIHGVMAQLGLGAAPIHTARSDDESWREGWKAFFKAEQLSPRFGACPPWAEQDPAVPQWIVIDPGMAFGTGNHATTRGVLGMLDDWLGERPPIEVLDVGCGSAILSIAAAKLGHRAVGVEIDPDALTNARENVETNGVGAQVRLVEGSAADIDGRFPLVIANILAPILIDIADGIQARCEHTLILSGLLPKQEAAVVAAYDQLQVVERRQQLEWVVLRLEKQA